jgi:hypothetical protein
MFVATDRYTINTDTINYAEGKEDGSTVLYFNNGSSISIPTAEAKAIFTSLIPRLEWSSPPQDS